MGDEAQERARKRVLDASFVAQVRECLQHLYDFPFLERHPLAAEDVSGDRRPGETAGQCLRRNLAVAIEALSPGPGASFLSPHARLYNILHLHYVEGSTILEAASDLSISRRQAYRDLRKGEEAVASVLFGQWAADAAEAASTAALSSLRDEMARVRIRRVPTNVGALLVGAQEAVAPLAQKHGVHLSVGIPRESVMVLTESMMARQIVVGLLSFAIQQSKAGTLSAVLTCEADHVLLSLRYAPRPEALDEPAVSPLVARLVDQLRWTTVQRDDQGIMRTVIVRMSPEGPTVVVVDDNEGLVELMDRYLNGASCRIVAAADGRQGLLLAQEMAPDAIVLDIMMPEMDGWEFLQRLRVHPQTTNIPVVICSVVNDPELAYSLGASLVLTKPIGRDQILAALRELGVL